MKEGESPLGALRYTLEGMLVSDRPSFSAPPLSPPDLS